MRLLYLFLVATCGTVAAPPGVPVPLAEIDIADILNCLNMARSSVIPSAANMKALVCSV